MDDTKLFKKYQWIEAHVTRSLKDPRPESYKIRSDDIKTDGAIPTTKGNWDARAEWILQPQNIFPSVEALQEQQQKDHTSLGLVQPLTVTDVRAEQFNQKEQSKFWQNYKDALLQMELPLNPQTGREIKPLRPPDYRFKIQFRCKDNRCQKDHTFSVLDWEIDALYFNLREQGNLPDIAANKVVDKLLNQVCASDKDLYFFLGNISTHPHIFTIVGLWWPKRKPNTEQLLLF
jgi:hypothetical protein